MSFAHGHCSYHAPLFAFQAATVCTVVWHAVQRVQAALGFDSFYRRNLRPVPGNENRSLDCMAVVVLLFDKPVDVLSSFPSLNILRPRIGYALTLLVHNHKIFIDGLQSLIQDPLRLKFVRCPLDIRHTNVTSLAWHPFFLTNFTMLATLDLVCIIPGLEEVHQHTHNTAFLFW